MTIEADVPTITVGRQMFFDISTRVTPNRYVRPRTDGFAIHHTVTGQHYATLDDELAHIDAINQYHIDKGYGGFGYQAISFESGRVYVVSDGAGARAHVANENDHLEGIAMVGDYRAVPPPLGIVLGCGRWLLAKYRQHGLQITRGHRDFVTLPEWSTACPGDAGEDAINAMMRTAVALARAGA